MLPSFNTRMQTAYSKYAPSVMSTVCEAMHFLAPIPDDNGPFVRARATLTIANADLAEYEAVLWGRSGQPLAVARQIGLLRDMAGAPEGSVAAELAKKAKL